VAIPTEQAPRDFVEKHQDYADRIFVASIKRWPITSLHPFGNIQVPFRLYRTNASFPTHDRISKVSLTISFNLDPTLLYILRIHTHKRTSTQTYANRTSLQLQRHAITPIFDELGSRFSTPFVQQHSSSLRYVAPDLDGHCLCFKRSPIPPRTTTATRTTRNNSHATLKTHTPHSPHTHQ
jgi:hypothetical protein